MPICFLKKSSSVKKAEAAPPAAAEASKPKASPAASKEAEGTMEHVITPGAEYASQNQRVRYIPVARYNFDDIVYDDFYYGAQDQMYYPNHGGSHYHAAAAPPYHPLMRSRSVPPPHPFVHEAPPELYSNYLPHPMSRGHYPPALPRRFSPAPPPWQRFSPAPAPSPWGQFGPRQHFGPPRGQFGPPRHHFGPPGRPFAPPPGYEYYGDF